MDKNAMRKQFMFLARLSETGCYGVKEEVEERIEEFLKAGVKTRSIMRILGNEGIFNNYDILLEYKAYINLTEVAKNLGGDFVYKNIEGFLTKIEDVDVFLEEVYDKDSFCEICEEYSPYAVSFELLRLGAKAETIFGLADKFLRGLAEDPTTLFEIVNSLVGYGLKRETAKSWLSERLTNNSFNLLLHCSRYKNILAKFGIDIKSFVDVYLQYYGEEHLRHSTSMPLPEWISMNTLAKHFPMRKIIDEGGPEFIYNFEDQDGNMGMLAKKFIDELGYPENYKDAFMLLIIVECGGALPVNFEKFAASVNAYQLNTNDKECFRETLSKHGVEANKLKKFT